MDKVGWMDQGRLMNQGDWMDQERLDGPGETGWTRRDWMDQAADGRVPHTMRASASISPCVFSYRLVN